MAHKILRSATCRIQTAYKRLDEVERVLKKLDSWQCSSLSSGGKLVLLDACLSNTPTYAMSIYLLPKTVVKKIDGTRKRFFWQGGGTKKSTI
jgi:hypothetical protein